MVKNKVGRAVHANKGIEVSYRKSLDRMISDMAASFQFWIKVLYKKYPPKISEIVQDSKPPSEEAEKQLAILSSIWKNKFNEVADRLATKNIGGIFKTSQTSMQESLGSAGLSVKFKMTPSVMDALNASISENVGLIKSIPVQYHKQVEGIVMRAYSSGRDLETLSNELMELHPITKKRATLIARDQCNKANSVVNRVRMLESGIKKAIWMHSHAGKQPRKDHVASNGKVYNVSEGCYISGEYIQPGQLINCRCTSRPVIPV